MWIAAPFQVAARTSDEQHTNHGLFLIWPDVDGHSHTWAMPNRLVHLEGNAIAAELADGGLRCGTSRPTHEQLKVFLGAVRSVNRIRCVERAGWHGSAYVLPNGRIFGAADEKIVLQSERVIRGDAFSAKGTLTEWQQNVAHYAVGNFRMLLSMSTAFAGPLLELLSELSGGIHVHGHSRTGKTTLLCVAVSAWGSGDVTRGQIRSWRATANGLETTAAEHSDNLLGLDEMGQLSAKDIGDVVYMLFNGLGKQRMRREGGGRPLLSWRLLLFSTGETTLAGKMSEAGLRARAGQEVRLLNLMADAGAGLGVFQNLHGVASAGAFADQLRLATMTYYGTAGPAFLEALVRARAEDPVRLADELRESREKFLAKCVPAGADGQVRSAALRFALIGIAGELARHYGVVPWPEGEALRAAVACFKVWLADRGGVGAAEDKQALEVIAAFIAAHGASRFERLNKNPDQPPVEQRVISRAGFVRETVDGQEFLIFPTVWRDEVCKGLDPRRVAEKACEAGHLIADEDGRRTQLLRIEGRAQARYYVVKDTILDATHG